MALRQKTKKTRTGGHLKRMIFLLLIVFVLFTVWALTDPEEEERAEVTAAEVQAEADAGPGSFTVDFIDVGQGDAALVQCDGHSMLIDGGPSDQSRHLYSYLKEQGITYLDYVVSTHPDADHAGGLSGALHYADAGTVFSPVTEYDSRTFETFLETLDRKDLEITVPEAGDTFSLGRASCTILGPETERSSGFWDDGRDSGSSDGADAKINNRSLVIRIVYGDTAFLFTGDAEEEEEEAMLRSGRPLRSTVLKAAHHGSAYSSTADFLKAVSPQYAVISVGADNDYGHPAKSALRRLKKAGAEIYRTDLQGTIRAVSDGKTVRMTAEKQ